MLNLAVCDDEAAAREELAGKLRALCRERQCPCHIAAFPDGQSLLDSADAFDLIFLDIQMPPPDGMETARALRQRGNQSLLVFVTVLREPVFDAFGVQAYDYLLKPIDPARLDTVMGRALTCLGREGQQRLVIRRGGTCRVVPLSQVLYCEVLGRKLYLHLQGGEVVDYYERLGALSGQVDSRFFLCHRSYLVNLDYVRSSSGGEIALVSGDTLPLARTRAPLFSQALLRRMRERG